jgi:hypothetical protein
MLNNSFSSDKFMKDNLFNPSNPKQDNAFNSTTSFADTAREIERQDRQESDTRILEMISATKTALEQTAKDISNE